MSCDLQPGPKQTFDECNKRYLSRHRIDKSDFYGFPYFEAVKMGLENCRSITSNADLTQLIMDIYDNAYKKLYSMKVEVTRHTIYTAASHVKDHQISHQYIFGHNTNIPKQRDNWLKKSGFLELVKAGRNQRKMVNKLSVMLIFNESEGLISFPFRDGNFDISNGFYSKDPCF
jgi:hypothetical protein